MYRNGKITIKYGLPVILQPNITIEYITISYDYIKLQAS